MTKRQETIENYRQILKSYIALPSISAQKKAIPETAAFLKKIFEAIGGHVEVLTDTTSPVVFADFPAQDPKKNATTLLIYNHYDVQPPEPLELWQSEPFELTERDGFLYARGICDCKGDLIARITALKLYLDAHDQQLPCHVKFLVEGEEEVASEHLGHYLAKYADKFAADVTVWESGSKNTKGQLSLVGGCKGICVFELSVDTAEADIHSSMAAMIEGAGWRLAQALTSLKDADNRIQITGFYDEVEEPTDKQKALIDAFDLDPIEIQKQYNLKRPFLTTDIKRAWAFEPTLNIEGISCGYEGEGVKTVLPKSAVAKIDCRLVPNQDPEVIAQKVQDYLNNNGFSDVKLHYSLGEFASRSDMDAPLVAEIIDVATNIYGGTQNIEVLPTAAGTGPTYLFEHYLNTPIVSFGVGNANSGAHAPNENIKIADYEQGIRLVESIFERFAQNNA